MSKLEYEKAVEQFVKTLDISKKAGDKWTIGSSSHQLGLAYIKTGKIDQAEKLLTIAKKIFEDIGNKRALSTIYNSISVLRTKQVKTNDALDAAKKAHDIAKEIGLTETNIATLISLGIIYSMKGEHQSLKKARNAFEKALDFAKQYGNRKLLADCYFKYARAFWMFGDKQDKTRARKNIAKALKVYKEVDLKARVREISKLLKKH
jgi:tetratricopeptide (TPR) repeat protein